MEAEDPVRDEAERFEREVRDNLPADAWLREPEFQYLLRAWARKQALADHAFRRMAEMGYDDAFRPGGLSGQGKSLAEIWKLIEERAARMRVRLGMKPGQWAALRKNLGIAQDAEAEALDALRRRGEQIRREQGKPDGTGT